jgi:hypothetical protein
MVYGIPTLRFFQNKKQNGAVAAPRFALFIFEKKRTKK